MAWLRADQRSRGLPAVLANSRTGQQWVGKSVRWKDVMRILMPRAGVRSTIYVGGERVRLIGQPASSSARRKDAERTLLLRAIAASTTSACGTTARLICLIGQNAAEPARWKDARPILTPGVGARGTICVGENTVRLICRNAPKEAVAGALRKLACALASNNQITIF